MELDDFKKLINQKSAGTQEVISEKSLREILHRQSENPVIRIRRKLLLEGGFSGFIILVFIILNLVIKGFLHPLAFWSLLIIFSGYFIFGLYTMFRLPREMDFGTDIHSFITEFLRQIKTYILLLERSIYITIPLGFVIGACSGLYFAVPEKFLAVLLSRKSILILSVSGVIISMGAFYLNRWLYKKIYGRQIAELELILDELNKQHDSTTQE